MQFTPTTTDLVCLQISVNSSQMDTVEVDYASLSVASDYGVVASHGTGTICLHKSAHLSDWQQFKTGDGSSQNLTICNGNIVQGQANGYGSVPIYASGLSGLTIENVNTLSTGIDTPAVNAANTSNGLRDLRLHFPQHLR